MRPVKHIAFAELRSLFYSPLAWGILISLYLLCIIGYFQNEQRFIIDYLKGGYSRRGLEFLTSKILYSLLKPVPWKQTILNYLFIFLPLITMGVFSREFRNGTDKLLFSSPIKTNQLVFGKMLGLILFNLCITLIVGIVFIYLGSNVASADWGLIFVNILGVFLLVLVLAAAGMFFSSLTSYQVVAGIISLVFFTIIFDFLVKTVEIAGKSGGAAGLSFYIPFQYIADYLRIVTPVSNGKIENFTKGIISIKELIYFLNLSAVFVAFTIVRLKSKRERISWRKKFIYYTSVISTAVIIGVISSNPYVNKSIDITREKVFTINPSTQELLKMMSGGPIEVNYYVNLMDNADWGTYSPFFQYYINNEWEQYRRFKPDIKLRFNYYYNHKGGEAKLLEMYPGLSEEDIAKKFAKAEEIPFGIYKKPEEINNVVKLDFEEYRHVAQVKYNGRSTFLRNFPTQENGPVPYLPEESEVAPALHRLIGNQPKVCFTTGHGELSPYKRDELGLKETANRPIIKASFINNGLDFDTISLSEKTLLNTCNTIAIGSPIFPLSEEFLQQFDTVLHRGMNLFICVHPDKREFSKPVLEKLGLEARPGVLGMESRFQSGKQVAANLTYYAREFSNSLGSFLEREPEYSKDTVSIQIDGAMALEMRESKGFTVEPFLVLRTEYGFNRPDATSLSEIGSRIAKLETDEIAPFSIAYKLKRVINGKEQRIIVMGSSDISSLGVKQLMLHMFGWLTDDAFPVDLVKPIPMDKTFSIQPGFLKVRKYIWVYGFTGILIILGSAILIRRSRK